MAKEKRIKVGILITGLGVGGAESHLLKVIPRIRHDSFIISITGNDELGKEIKRKGVRVYYLGLKKMNLINAVIRFRKIIRKEKPDVLDTYLIHANLFGRVFAKLFGVKKIINSVRNDYSDHKLLNFIDRITKSLVDIYVPNSKALVRYLHMKNGVPLSMIKVLQNGIDIEGLRKKVDRKYRLRKELGISNDAFIISCVSRLEKHKNIFALAEAVEDACSDTVLVIAGKGPEKDRIIRMIKSKGLEKRVFLVGLRRDVQNIVSCSDAFCLPSLKEGMSNALLEAMALKKPCIVSKIPQNEELVKEGLNGFLFNPLNKESIVSALDKAVKSKMLNKMGDESFKIIKRYHDINDIAVLYEKIVEEVLDE